MSCRRPGEGREALPREQRAVPLGHVHQVILVDGEVPEVDRDPLELGPPRRTARHQFTWAGSASYMPWYTTVSVGPAASSARSKPGILAGVEHGALERQERRPLELGRHRRGSSRRRRARAGRQTLGAVRGHEHLRDWLRTSR